MSAIHVSDSEQAIHRDSKRQQRDLKIQGFDPGPIDGQIGPWTRRAMGYSSSVCRALDMAVTNRDLFLARAIVDVGNLPRRIVMQLESEIPTQFVDGRYPKITNWNYNTLVIHRWASVVYGQGQTLVPLTQQSSSMMEKPTWIIGAGGIPPQAGDLFGVWHETQGRVGHAGVILDWLPGEKYFMSVEAQHDDRYHPKQDGWPRVVVRRRVRSDAYCVKHVEHAGEPIRTLLPD